MTKVDFSTYAKPWLGQLHDDPNQPEPISCPSTTFPGLDNDFAGEVELLDGDNSQDNATANLPVDEEDARAAQRARPMAGLDVLAFYKSFRFIARAPFPGRWGIFLLGAGLEGLARDFKEHKPSLSHVEAWQFARETLLAHERYHFWIDVWALSKETTPLDIPLIKRYEYYRVAKQVVALTFNDLEESIANHYVFNKLRRRVFVDGSMAAPVLRKVLLDGPSPYSDFNFGPETKVNREGRLALAVANGMNPISARMGFEMLRSGVDPTVLAASIQPVDRRHPVFGYSGCPTYFVRARNYAGLVQPFQGPLLKEFQLFLRNYLRGEKEVTTDHDYYRIDNGQKIKFPNPHDKEVRGYELKGTLIKAGMTKKEFDIARDQTERWKKMCPRTEVKQPLSAT